MNHNKKLVFWTVLTALVLFVRHSGAASYKYTVTVKTGTQSRPGILDGPGTDATPKIILYGVSRTTNQEEHTEPLKLSGSLFKNNFESGQTDTFKGLKDSKDLTKISKIRIKRSNFGIGPDWLLDQVAVKTKNGEVYTFKANFWLTKSDKYYEFLPTGPPPPTPIPTPIPTPSPTPSPTLSPTPAVPTPAVPTPPRVPATATNPVAPVYKYTVVVTTGTKRRPGILDGPGASITPYIMLYGVSRTTNQVGYTQPLKLSGSALKAYFEAGQTATFTGLGDPKDLTKIDKIRVKRDNNGVGPDWLLDKVIVKTQNGEEYPFTANLWLTEADKYYELPTIVPPPSDQTTPGPVTPAPGQSPGSSTTPDIIYAIIVYTGTAADASSRANVYIKMYGIRGTSAEIHLRNPNGNEVFSSASSKVFQTKIPDLDKLLKIQIRQDGLGASPNWNIDKVMIIAQNEKVYEFIINGWLGPSAPVVQTLSDEYPAMSIKFKSYPPCVHPLTNPVHPAPKTPLVLADGCSKLFTFFRLLPNGVILHLSSGMCLQSDSTGDPKTLVSGTTLILNPQCIVYNPGAGTPHALQFKLTNTGGSLMEINSGKCVSTNQGAKGIPLTFSDSCNTEVVFIGKTGDILIPEKTAKAPPQPPAPPAPTLPPAETPTQPSSVTPRTGSEAPKPELNVIDPLHPEYGGNNSRIPDGTMSGFCSGGCSSACQPSCTQACCGGQQQPVQPANNGFPSIFSYPQPTVCPPDYCTPANCRSFCHISCCLPKTDPNVWKKLMIGNDRDNRPNGTDWD